MRALAYALALSLALAACGSDNNQTDENKFACPPMTALDIHITVLDAASGAPINNASGEVRPLGGSYGFGLKRSDAALNVLDGSLSGRMVAAVVAPGYQIWTLEVESKPDPANKCGYIDQRFEARLSQ